MPARFPPPWSVKASDESFAIVDATGYPIAYVYCPAHEFVGTAPDTITRDQARRIALNIAKLPELLGR